MTTVIGPNGKDVYAIAICHVVDFNVCLVSALVEALSFEEAHGIASLMAKNLEADEVMIHVQSKFGPFDAKTLKFADYMKARNE